MRGVHQPRDGATRSHDGFRNWYTKATHAAAVTTVSSALAEWDSCYLSVRARGRQRFSQSLAVTECQCDVARSSRVDIIARLHVPSDVAGTRSEPLLESADASSSVARTITRATTLACAAALTNALAGCGGSSPVGICAAPAPRSVAVTVRDSISGAAAATNALGTIVGASIDDTLAQYDSLTLEGGDRLGTFTVTIEKAGYFTWSRANVRVTETGPCGNVIPVSLTARLQPQTP